MKKYFLSLCALFFLYNVQAQLILESSYTVEEMVTDFFDGSCVQVSNVDFSGGDVQIAYFDASQIGIGVNAGIFLSTGNVSNAYGPNSSTGENSNFSAGGSSDSDLNSIILSELNTVDAAVLEFDFIPSDTEISFDYIFASEEYPEWVCSQFNDVFAFFISGPSILGKENIALIPNTNTPVSINSVNDGSDFTPNEYCLAENYIYYQSNESGEFNIEFDGLTALLSCHKSGLIPGETYHAKIAVADVADAIYDSGVFLSVTSLCGTGKVVADFELEKNDKTVSFTNYSKYGTNYLWDFGDENTSSLPNPAAHTYSNNGTYIVSLTVENFCCTEIFEQEIRIGNPIDVESFNVINLLANNTKITPNPTKSGENVYYQLPQNLENSSVVYTIFDLQGKKINEQDLTQLQGILKLPHLEEGIYWHTIQSGNQVIFQEKMMVFE